MSDLPILALGGLAALTAGGFVLQLRRFFRILRADQAATQGDLR